MNQNRRYKKAVLGHSLLACCLILVLPCLATAQEQANTPPTNTAPEGFTELFNGKNLDGWYAIKTLDPRKMNAFPEEERKSKIEAARKTTGEHWRVEDGEIVNDGKGPYLTTDREFRDFELHLEYKTVAKADSGVYLKSTPQVQIWDTTEEGGKWGKHLRAELGSGGLWNNKKGQPEKDPLVKADKPFGEWNKFRIVQIGARTSVWLNDKLVVDHAIMRNYWGEMPLIAKGPIQLQTHGGEIRWKNLFVREFKTEEANKLLASKSNEGFESIFNGKDLTGWKGAVKSHEVKNEIIRCLPGTAGTMYHEKEYSDFVARLEFRLPPGGNNGLAIRYPGGDGTADTAYLGMCELQVLDSTHPKFAKLDARQYHGSAYGMQAAHRGYLREPGQWNFQEVTVKGSTIQVELNGTVILDCDVAKIDKYLGKPVTGKDRKSGYFGMAGHGDPVEFRNLSIKSLAMSAEEKK